MKRTHKDAAAGTAAPSGQTSEPKCGDRTTQPLRLQLTDDDRASDLAARHWAFLKLIYDSADASAPPFEGKL